LLVFFLCKACLLCLMEIQDGHHCKNSSTWENCFKKSFLLIEFTEMIEQKIY
jgi:hypothetical protein